jgi:hypothetical protein
MTVGVALILNFENVATPTASSLSARQRTKFLFRKSWNLGAV